MKIAVTGATGYIGSHFVKVAAEHGHKIIATDFNLNQNDIEKYCEQVLPWDITARRYKDIDVDKTVHIAAKTKVPNSVRDPWIYFQTNCNGTKNVIDAFPCDHFVYCSTGSAFNPGASPYALTKYGGELITKQFCENHSIARFYNVSGNDGYKKYDDEYTHLVRRAAAVANGKFDELYIHGTDYDTRDGTCIRNYTHVVDIVESLMRIVENKPTGEIDCLGVPEGTTVREVINTMCNVSRKNLKIIEGPRREGDIPVSTVPTKSIHFQQTKTLEQICEDALLYEV